MESVNTQASPVLEIRDLSVFYGRKAALTSLSMAVPPRGITAILGPSGCGKTTLLQSLNGMLRENKEVRITGNILLGGLDTGSMDQEALRRRVGLVFQTPAPFPFSIYKNMTYGLRYYGMRRKDLLNAAVEEKLRVVGLWEEVRDELGKSALKLSGGQQQRLCIARSISVDPEVLLLDEPCSALDVKATAVIEQMLCTMKRSYAMVMVTHNIAQARRIADHVAVLYEGRLVEFGPSEDIFAHPKEQLTREFLGGIYG